MTMRWIWLERQPARNQRRGWPPRTGARAEATGKAAQWARPMMNGRSRLNSVFPLMP